MKRFFDITTPSASATERNLFLCKVIDDSSIESIVKDIIKINEEDDYQEKVSKVHNMTYERFPIKLHLDTRGGMVYPTFGLLSVMKKSQTPIHTIVTGCAMSAGFMILISGHKRFAYDMSTVLYHQMASGAWGTLKEIEEDFFQYQKIQAKIEEIVLENTKISKKKLKEIYEKKIDWYMNAKEAKALNVIDEII